MTRTHLMSKPPWLCVGPVIKNEKQTQTLATLRVTLLPRLISGQSRLPDVEVLHEEAFA